MNLREVFDALDRERRSLARDGEIVEELPNLTRVRPEDNSYHVIMYTNVSPENADELIAAQKKHYGRLNAGFEWKVYGHDQPPDLLQRLVRAGFIPGPAEAVMIYDLANAADWIAQASHGPRVARVDSLDLVADFRRVAEAVFQKEDDFTSKQLAAGIAAGSTQHLGYVAYDGARPVSIGRLYTHPDSRFGGLFGGGTLAEFRGRGAYRAVVAARARDAIAHGARYLMVDALPTSRPILERLGFQRATDTWPCTWNPS